MSRLSILALVATAQFILGAFQTAPAKEGPCLDVLRPADTVTCQADGDPVAEWTGRHSGESSVARSTRQVARLQKVGRHSGSVAQCSEICKRWADSGAGHRECVAGCKLGLARLSCFASMSPGGSTTRACGAICSDHEGDFLSCRAGCSLSEEIKC